MTGTRGEYLRVTYDVEGATLHEHLEDKFPASVLMEHYQAARQPQEVPRALPAQYLEHVPAAQLLEMRLAAWSRRLTRMEKRLPPWDKVKKDCSEGYLARSVSSLVSRPLQAQERHDPLRL